MSVLFISREFKTNIETVFEAWSKAGHMQQWWGQDGMETIVKSFVFKPGGVFHYAFVLTDGIRLWGKFEYGEIEPTNKIVFTNSFSDENGETMKAPANIFGHDWPLKMRNIITLESTGQGTIMNFEAYPENASDEEQRHFESHLEDLRQSFQNLYNRMEKFLLTQ